MIIQCLKKNPCTNKMVGNISELFLSRAGLYWGIDVVFGFEAPLAGTMGIYALCSLLYT